MKRSITRWTTALATVGALGLPVAGFARTQEPQQQQPQPAPAQPTQPQPSQPKPEPAQPTQPQPSQPQPQPAQPQPAQPDPQPAPPATAAAQQAQPDQAVSPQEHLRQAQAALNSISATSVPAKNRAALAQMKRHLTALERAGAPAASATTPAPAPKTGAGAAASWGTEVAAVDKLITEMIGSDTAPATTGATPTPSPTGTAGTAKAAAIDEATRAKLMEVRTHITAFATGMSGATSTPKTDAPTTEPPAAAAAAQSPSAAAPSPSATAATATPTPEQSAAAPAQGATAAAQPQVDAEAARRALMAARDNLSQLTQLPAAAQLAGEPRTQITQLISNFNELITTQSNWRASYDKVAANLTALIGPDTGSAETTAAAPAPTAPAPTAPAPTATPGAVGTAGSTAATATELDPAIRAKLVELRRNLVEFQKASSGTDK